MSHSLSFANFNPLTGKVPSHLKLTFGGITNRARQIISNRTAEEIHYCLESLDWMLEKGHELTASQAAKTWDIDMDTKCYGSSAKALRLYANHFDIREQKSMPNAKLSEYFAVIALALVGDAKNVEVSSSIYEYFGGDPEFEESLKEELEDYEVNVVTDIDEYVNKAYKSKKKFKRYKPVFIQDLALYAMEAVCFAECYEEFQKRTIERVRKGGRYKAAKYDDLKTKVKNLYLEKHQHRSNREAAKRILKELPKADLEVLSCDAPQQRLEIWISQFRKK